MTATLQQTGLADLHSALCDQGLVVRGGWKPSAPDHVPTMPGGKTAAWVWMVGNLGSDFWPIFGDSPEFHDGLPDPMDRWTRRIGQDVARRFDAQALFPFDGPPYAPFQRWALRCSPMQRSPLGLLIDPQQGLWQALRFVLAFAEEPAWAGRSVGAGTRAAQISVQAVGSARVIGDICSRCDGQPCLSACPVDAFTGTDYRVQDCTAFLQGPDGEDCMGLGCQARRACPVGTASSYRPDHAAFHMAAFSLASRHEGI